MLGADFAAATVLISFGVLIGKTSPLQLIVMAMIEIVLFFGNEIIGRQYFGVIILNINNSFQSLKTTSLVVRNI